MDNISNLISLRNYLSATLEIVPKEYYKSNQRLINKIDLLINKKIQKSIIKYVDDELLAMDKDNNEISE